MPKDPTQPRVPRGFSTGGQFTVSGRNGGKPVRGTSAGSEIHSGITERQRSLIENSIDFSVLVGAVKRMRSVKTETEARELARVIQGNNLVERISKSPALRSQLQKIRETCSDPKTTRSMAAAHAKSTIQATVNRVAKGTGATEQQKAGIVNELSDRFNRSIGFA